jgi:hypothetical protein
MNLFYWFKSFLEAHAVEEPPQVKEEAKFPPLPPKHFFRVRENRLHPDSCWPLFVEVHKKMSGGEERYITLAASEATPEGIAEAMHKLSEKLMRKHEASKNIKQYCGDYYP